MSGKFWMVGLLLVGCSRPEVGVWMQKLPVQSAIKPELLQQLAGSLGQPPDRWVEPIQKDRQPRVLWLTWPDGKITLGRGPGLRPALESALGQKGPLQSGWLKLDLVSLSDNRREKLETGMDGLAWSEPPEALLPDLISHRALLKSGKLRKDYGERLHTAQRAEPPAFRFQTQQALWTRQTVEPLFRGHRLYRAQDLTSAQLLKAARLAGDFLVRQLDARGHFDYAYHPAEDHSENSYNSLRHAGACYALCQLSRASQQPAYAQAAARGLGYLVGQLKPVAGGGLALVEQRSVKLGGNALAVIALLEYQQTTGDRRWWPQARRLGRTLLAAQVPSGAFPVHKSDFTSGANLEFTSGYYPGEALLALLYLDRQEPAGPWLAAAQRGARYLILERDHGLGPDKLPHDHWLLLALDQLQQRKPDPLYPAHMQKLCTAICSAQLHHQPELDWNGGFYRPPRTGPTAIRCEGMAAAWPWLQKSQQEIVRQSLLDGMVFQLQAQLQPESCVYFPKPERPLGAIPRSLTNFEVRIDYSQHFISAALGARRLFNSP
ncbi:hypothetical protein JST97_16235 [bacterium]|nr:hypothetical protein [bacterium]